jgi:hypothetical protein
MRSILFLTAIALGSCDSLFGLHDPAPRGDASHPGDDAPDHAIADARACWDIGMSVCFTTPPSGSLTLSGALDTTAGAMCSSMFSDDCVIAAETITIAASTSFTVTGTRPLVLAATDRLTIAGTLDVASHVATPALSGPGAAIAACGQFASIPDTNGTDGTGGGAGGSFGGVGEAGGSNASGAHGGGKAPAIPGKEFRAGCRGQDGANPAATFGLGGAGGGATYLIGGTAIEITGTVNASGAGGLGGECTDPCNNTTSGKAHGGGGGGTGGMVVLDSPSISNTGVIFADGGGGGEGASHTQSGLSGTDPTGTAAAAGGDRGSFNGGVGGAGAHATINPTPGGEGSSSLGGAGGGGGGGGAGKIVVYGGTLTGAVSPTPTP